MADNDIITTPDGLKIPRSLLSPEVQASLSPEQTPLDESIANAVSDESLKQTFGDENLKRVFSDENLKETFGGDKPTPPTRTDFGPLGNNLLTTAKEAGQDYLHGLVNPIEGAKMVGKGLTDIAEMGAVSQGMVARNVLNGLRSQGVPVPTLDQYFPKSEPQQPKPPSPGPSNSPAGQVLQLAMGAGGVPGDSTSLRASAPGTPSFAGYGGVQRDLRRAAGEQSAATKQLGEIQAQRAAEVAGEQEGRVRAMEQEELRRQAVEQRAQQVSQEQIQKAEALQGELRQLSTQKVDPDHFWAEKSTGSKLAAAFGVFLGGLGGGPNQALGILNNAIDRDIQAQQANFERARSLKVQEIEGQKNIYGMYLNQLGDQRAATAAARAASLDIFNQRIAASAAKFDSPEFQARAQAAQAAIQQELAKSQKQVLDAVNENAYRRATLEMQQYEINQRAAAAQAAAQAKQRGTYVPGVGIALDEESKKKVQEIAGAYNETKAALQQMQELRKQAGGGEVLDRDLVRKMRSAQTAFIGSMNRMQKFGALDKGAQDLLSQLSGGDITDFGSSIDSALAQAGKTLENSFQGQTKPYMAQYEDTAQPVTSFVARK